MCGGGGRGGGGGGEGDSYKLHPRLVFRWCWFFVVDFCPIERRCYSGLQKVVGSISEETLDPRRAVSPGDGSGWGMEIHCFCEFGNGICIFL